jgi:hypothetical protein
MDNMTAQQPFADERCAVTGKAIGKEKYKIRVQDYPLPYPLVTAYNRLQTLISAYKRIAAKPFIGL